MNVVILCAGFATRMYPLTKNFPKPLLEVGGKTVLDYLVEQIVTLPEIEDIHIVSNGKFFDHFDRWRQIREKAGTFRTIPVLLHNDQSVDNKSRIGAAGDLLFALQQIERVGKVLVSGGDNIFRFSLGPLLEKFSQSRNHAITALIETDQEKLQKTGVLEIDGNNRVLKLHEKPALPQSTWISPPLYFFQPSVKSILESFLKTPGNHDAPGFFIDYLCHQEEVHAIKVRSERIDIGCLKTYHEADRQLSLETVY